MKLAVVADIQVDETQITAERDNIAQNQQVVEAGRQNTFRFRRKKRFTSSQTTRGF